MYGRETQSMTGLQRFLTPKSVRPAARENCQMRGWTLRAGNPLFYVSIVMGIVYFFLTPIL